MEWSTHMLSGVLAGYAVTGGDWKGAVIGGLAGVIPDVDEPRSRVGKTLFFISFPISPFIKHRTFTHSLLFSIIAGCFFFLVFNLWVGLSVAAGIIAHIIGDILTGKVQLLYPKSNWYGFNTSSLNFLLIDRGTRYGLLTLLLFLVVQQDFINLGGLFN